MVDVDCYNCNSARKEPYATENGFALVKCSDCGLLYVTPRPSDDEIERAARSGNHKGESALNSSGSFSILKMRSYKKVLIDLYGAELTKKRATWLDIGCGHGEFLMALEEFSNGNVTAKGIEPNDNKQASARERKLDVSFFDIKSHKQKYDVISLLNVYSHLPDPPEFLNYCRNIINTGGELVLQTGDSAHLSAKELYRPLCLPVHLSIASESIIRGILTRVGFEVLFVYKYFVIQPNIISLIKELIKIVWPNKTSMLRYLWNPKYRTDMFIRAKKNSTHHG